MALPSNWDTVLVHGRYVDMDGTPATGAITFTGGTRLRSAAEQVAVLPGPITVPLDDNGEFSYELPVTDDPDMAPSGWAWEVYERFGPPEHVSFTRSYTMVARRGESIDLTNVVPAVPPGEAPVVPWRTVAGKTANAEGDVPLGYTDLTGTVPTEALPALALTDVHTVADKDAMLALHAQQGDVAIRTDQSRTYILATDDPSVSESWVALAVPPDVVTSVAGRTGAVELAPGDVGLDRVDNTSDAAKPLSDAARAALEARVGIERRIEAGPGLTGGGTLDEDRTLSVAFGAGAGTAAEGNDPRLVGAAQRGANLSDLPDPAASRASLGLGAAAIREVGSGAGTVAAGDDPRLTTAAARSFVPVANGTHFNGNGAAGTEGLVQTRCRQSRKLLRVIAGGADTLQVEWANIYTSNTPSGSASREIPGPNPVSVRMAVEYPAGTPRITAGSAAWQSGTAYAVGDQVNHSGASWLATAASTGHEPADGSVSWRRVLRYTVRWSGDDGGAGTKTFAPGDYAKSQPVELAERLIPGDKIAVYGAFDTGSSTGRLPYAGASGACNTVPFVDWVVDAPGGMPAAGASLPETGITNQSNGNTTSAGNTNAAAWMRIPFATAITGNIPGGRCLALLGDSLMQGYGGDIRDGEPCGWFVRAMDGYGSWWRLAQGGNRASCYFPGSAPWQMSVIARCSAVVTDLSLGDVQANYTTAQTKTAMTTLWRELARQGTPVYGGYLTPIAGSTDNWVTVANQTRWTDNGQSATTQFATDADYGSTVYGQIATWLSQGGAETTVDGATVKAGQQGHALSGLLDWRAMLADASSSWKWGPGYTADGAHGNAFGAVVQGSYLAPQLAPVIMGNKQVVPLGEYIAQVESPVQPMPRSLVADSCAVVAGSVMGIIGVSPGRYYYGFRLAAGSAAGSRAYSILVGADPAKMRVIQSGTFTTTANAVRDTALSGIPVWIPAGYLIAVAVSTGQAANSWLGRNASWAAMNNTGFGFLLGGQASGDTAALAVGTTVNLHSTGGRYAADRFRLWGEAY